MISAPNHRLPSNGSSLWLFFCLLSLGLSSCAFFQPAEGSTAGKSSSSQGDLGTLQGSRVFNPSTGEWMTVRQVPVERMDTIRWKEVSENQRPPIRSTGLVTDLAPKAPAQAPSPNQSEFLNTYNLALVLPFMSHQFQSGQNELPEHSGWALQFYSGARMALEELEGEGLGLQVSVVDTRGPETPLAPILRTDADLRSANLIIGAYRREHIRELAEFARTNNINYVSPYSAAADLTANNPNFIQVSPTLQAHCSAITRHALRHFRPDQIVLIGRENEAEKSRLRLFQEEYFQLFGSRNTPRLQEFILPSGNANDLNALPFMQLQDTTVFIVPVWDEAFIYSFMRKVDLTKQPYQTVVVYGMPQWMQFDQIDLDYFEKLNVRVSSNFFIDELAPQVQFFRRRYFDRFGTTPTLEAFLGYDTVLFFGRMLQKYGTRFQYQLDREGRQYLHTRFEFLPVARPLTTGAERLPVDRFENRYVNILKFRDYQFQLDN